MTAKAIMVLGTTSDAGKSFVAAALCRIFAQDGYKVAPFKSQNMALNSYIPPKGWRWAVRKSCRLKQRALSLRCS